MVNNANSNLILDQLPGSCKQIYLQRKNYIRSLNKLMVNIQNSFLQPIRSMLKRLLE